MQLFPSNTHSHTSVFSYDMKVSLHLGSDWSRNSTSIKTVLWQVYLLEACKLKIRVESGDSIHILESCWDKNKGTRCVYLCVKEREGQKERDRLIPSRRSCQILNVTGRKNSLFSGLGEWKFWISCHLAITLAPQSPHPRGSTFTFAVFLK